jgi:hypothetical protein
MPQRSSTISHVKPKINVELTQKYFDYALQNKASLCVHPDETYFFKNSAITIPTIRLSA